MDSSAERARSKQCFSTFLLDLALCRIPRLLALGCSDRKLRFCIYRAVVKSRRHFCFLAMFVLQIIWCSRVHFARDFASTLFFCFIFCVLFNFCFSFGIAWSMKETLHTPLSPLPYSLVSVSSYFSRVCLGMMLFISLFFYIVLKVHDASCGGFKGFVSIMLVLGGPLMLWDLDTNVGE